MLGSVRAPSPSWTSAFGSSTPAVDDAARPVILEAAADECTPFASSAEASVSPAIALIALAVEGEAERPAAVDAAARGQAIGWLMVSALRCVSMPAQFGLRSPIL